MYTNGFSTIEERQPLMDIVGDGLSILWIVQAWLNGSRLDEEEIQIDEK